MPEIGILEKNSLSPREKALKYCSLILFNFIYLFIF